MYLSIFHSPLLRASVPSVVSNRFHFVIHSFAHWNLIRHSSFEFRYFQIPTPSSSSPRLSAIHCARTDAIPGNSYLHMEEDQPAPAPCSPSPCTNSTKTFAKVAVEVANVLYTWQPQISHSR